MNDSRHPSAVDASTRVTAGRQSGVESLEPRRLFSVYAVNGTSYNDVITINYGTPPVVAGRTSAAAAAPVTPVNQLVVTVNGVKSYPKLAAGQTITVNAGVGHDRVTVVGNKPTTLVGGWGRDTLIGGGGNDSLLGEQDDDTLDGGYGADVISGAAGRDTVDYSLRGSPVQIVLDTSANDGQSGEYDKVLADIEVLKGGFAGDYFANFTNDDVPRVYYGNSGNDLISGGRGRETLYGGAGNDTVHGNDGADELFADSGNDSLSGGGDLDTLYGGTGQDTLNGGVGSDLLISIGGGQRDKVYGGSEVDNFWTDAESTEIIADASSTENKRNVHRVAAFEKLKVGSNFVSVSRERNIGNLPDPDATINSTMHHYQNFGDKPLFRNLTVPSADDINQGNVGDCYFLSPLSAIADTAPDVIRDSVISLGDGTYAVRFRRDGVAKYVRVDADLPVNSSGKLIFAGAGTAGIVMWAPIMEKAWAFFRYNRGAYSGAAQGQTSETFKTLGLSWDDHDPYHLINDTADTFAAKVNQLLQQRKAVTYSTGGDSELVKNHSYMVDRVVSTGTRVTHIVLRNPWANDGPGGDAADDGYVTLTIAKALKNCEELVFGNA